VIYLDSSVALAHILAETRAPPASIWREPLISSRLLEYEVWNRIHGRGLTQPQTNDVRFLLQRVSMIALAPSILERALEPFPTHVRTLDALHLASVEFLRKARQDVRLATYDARLSAAAGALGIPLMAL
jgi:hypothetical protein